MYCKRIKIVEPSVYNYVDSRFFIMKKRILPTIFILLISFLGASFGQSDVKVILSTQVGLTIEYSPKYLDSDNFFRDSKNQILPLFEGASDIDLSRVGESDLRYRSFSIGLPSLTNNTVRILDVEFADVNGASLKKVPTLIRENGFLVKSEIELPVIPKVQSKLFTLASLDNIGFIREKIVGLLRIYPYQEIEDFNRVRIYKKVTVQINYGFTSVSHIPKPQVSLINSELLNARESANWNFESSKNVLKKISNSVLSFGNWYKIKITEEGMYKLDNAFLKSKGIDLGSVDPRSIKIYGNGGKLIDERPEQPRTTDLIENSIRVVGEEDGKFDNADYIIFYAPAAKGWEYSSSINSFGHYFHYYSDNNFVWLTWDGANGKRMDTKISVPDAGAELVTTTTGFVLNHEFKKNIAKTGRQWFGDEFNDRTNYRVYTNKLPGLIPDKSITYKFSLVSRAPKLTTFSIDENSIPLGSIAIPSISLNDVYSAYANLGFQIFTRNSNLPENRSIIRLTYNTTDPIANGYLHYFEIHYPRYLRADGDKIMFFSPTSDGLFEYEISDFSNSQIDIYDVTQFSSVKRVEGASISGGQAKFRSFENGSVISTYFAIGKDGYLVPTELTKVGNQNLHGIADGAEFVIITTAEFKSHAERLKTFKTTRKNHPLSTLVIDIKEIYNEFSSGILDVSAIRDFLKYAYTNWALKPVYVLLFGDGDYDYRNVEGYGKNFIPPYETVESLLPLYSYPTDDYYARIVGNDLYIDLAIGRINCRSADEARITVDKIINYESSTNFGSWRNLITLVADDGKTSVGDDGDMHTIQSDSLYHTSIPKSFDVKKIYLIQYPTVETASGRRKPAVNKAIIDAVNEGTLVLNFIGHGNPDVWTHEYVFEKALTIPQFNNKDKLFFLSAATCDFGEYDNPSSQSSTELLINKEDGGAILVFTAARAVFADLNYLLNAALFVNLFGWRNSNLSQPSVGLAFFRTKAFKIDANDQKYHLYGDPTVYLNVPRFKASVDSINSISTNSVVEIKSLKPTSVIGIVKDSSGNILSSFNGEALITVFDSKRYQEIPEWPRLTSRYGGIELPGGIIFRGRSAVRNGVFETDFVVPKDVSYENNNGKVTVYFFNSENDGFGFTENIKVTAADTIAIADKAGPKIDIYLDNDYSSGAYLVGKSPLLIVKFEDETGINTTGTGLGHKMEAVLNEDITNPYDLTNYFQGDLNQGNRKGEVRYKFSGLDSGPYKLKITAWDVFNNPSSADVTFEVVGENLLAVRDIFNYPNPTSGPTTFTFQHSYDKPINVTLKIYSIAGRHLFTIEKQNVLEKFVKVDWDGKDTEGDVLGNGVYLYKIIVNSIDNNIKNEAIGKLAIIR